MRRQIPSTARLWTVSPTLARSCDVDGDHGRIETREAFICAEIGWLQAQQACPEPGRHRQGRARA